MLQVKDLTDNIFGRLRVVSRAPNKGRAKRWNCICSCGKELVVYGSHLVQGNTSSCGCRSKEVATARLLKHGKTKSREFGVWSAMLTRCYNPNHQAFKHYGGRGIKVCNEWRNDFLAFLNHLGGSIPVGMTIDRKDNDGDYSPENVSLVSTKDQSRNRRSSVLIEYNGMRMCATDWANEKGIRPKTLLARLSRGWSIERAMVEPVIQIHPTRGGTNGASGLSGEKERTKDVSEVRS